MRASGWVILAALLCTMVWGLHSYAEGVVTQIRERDAAACPDGRVTWDQRCVYP